MHASIALPLTTDIEPPCALYRKFLQRGYVKHRSCQAVVKTTFNASTQGRGRGRIRGKIRGRGRGRQIFVNSRPTWSIGQVPGQPEVLHKETLCQKKKGRKKKNLQKSGWKADSIHSQRTQTWFPAQTQQLKTICHSNPTVQWPLQASKGS